MPISEEIINKIETKEYVITRLNRDNLADVAKLHTAVYGTAPANDYFPKKYNTQYAGVENVGFVAYNREGVPVAYYGVIPCFIQYGDNIVLAAQSADTMTHPAHRYKGMFVELSKMTFDLCREFNIFLIFGFPNQNSYHGAINKLGWQMTGTMACFVIPVKSLPLESLSKKIEVFRKIYRRYTGYMLDKKALPMKGVANSVLVDGFAGVHRSDEYLQYKAYSSTKVIRIADAKLWISNRHGLMIGDMEGITGNNFEAVINKLKGFARTLGIRQIQFHCSPDTNLYNCFLKKYKANPSYPILFQNLGSAILPEKIKFTFADIDIF